MNIRKIVFSLLLIGAPLVSSYATLPPPALGGDVGSLLSSPTFLASEWKLPKGGTLEKNAIILTSQKENLRLYCLPAFAGDILIQARLQNVEKNHTVRLLINKDFSVCFSNQFRRVTLEQVDGGYRYIEPPLFSVPYVDGHIPAENPDDFVVTLSLRGASVTVWIDGVEVAQLEVPGLAAPYKITFVSGWMSDWTLADFAVHALKPL